MVSSITLFQLNYWRASTRTWILASFKVKAEMSKFLIFRAIYFPFCSSLASAKIVLALVVRGNFKNLTFEKKLKPFRKFEQDREHSFNCSTVGNSWEQRRKDPSNQLLPFSSSLVICLCCKLRHIEISFEWHLLLSGQMRIKVRMNAAFRVSSSLSQL